MFVKNLDLPKNIFRIAKAIIFLLAAIPACSSAQVNEIITDRPDQTESPFTVPRRHFQMETGLVFEKTNSNTETFVYPATLIKYGLTDRFELRLIMEFSTINASHESISGLNPVHSSFSLSSGRQYHVHTFDLDIFLSIFAIHCIVHALIHILLILCS